MEILTEIGKDESLSEYEWLFFLHRPSKRKSWKIVKEFRHIFVTKPDSLEGYEEMIKTVEKFLG